MSNECTNSGFGVRNADGSEVKLAMQRLWLTGTLLPAGARLVLRHDFTSGEKKPLEVVYTFMLPRDAALSRFRIVGEGFEAHSELRPVKEAEQKYEEGIQSGHTAVLTQVHQDGIVNLNVGNIRPGESVSVLLEIAAGVELREDGFQFRFPFTMAPGYHGKATAVQVDPDTLEMTLPEEAFGDLLLPPWKSGAKGMHAVGFDLGIELPGALQSVSSPSHPLSVRLAEKKRQSVQLATTGDVPDRDLVIDVQYAIEAPVVLAGLDSSGKGRFIALVPLSSLGEKVTEAPKRVVFLLDRSGSMGGEEIKQARSAIVSCLGSLGELDQFGIVAFDNQTESLNPQLLPATHENIEKATSFLQAIDARGGTEMALGLEAAAKMFGKAHGDVLLITDGQVFGTEDIVSRAQAAGIRLHFIGIGAASRDRFSVQMARQTGGTSHWVSPGEAVDKAVIKAFTAIGVPLAEALCCEAKGLNGFKVEPALPEFVYSGHPVLVMGSWTGQTMGEICLSWKHAGKDCESLLTVHPQEGTLGETLKLLQGARLISDAESSVTENAESRAAGKRQAGRKDKLLRALGEDYGLASQAMSLVAVVKREGDREGDIPTTQVVPLAMPRELEMQNCNTQLRSSSYNFSDDMRIPCYHRRIRTSFRGDVPDWSLSLQSPDQQCGMPVSPPPSDLCRELVALIQADGGLLGATEAVRVAASLLVLTVFHQLDKQGHAGYIRRIRRFLDSCDIGVLTEKQAKAFRELLELLDRSGTIHGPWVDIACEFKLHPSQWDSKKYWSTLRRVQEVFIDWSLSLE